MSDEKQQTNNELMIALENVLVKKFGEFFFELESYRTVLYCINDLLNKPLTVNDKDLRSILKIAEKK